MSCTCTSTPGMMGSTGVEPISSSPTAEVPTMVILPLINAGSAVPASQMIVPESVWTSMHVVLPPYLR